MSELWHCNKEQLFIIETSIVTLKQFYYPLVWVEALFMLNLAIQEIYVTFYCRYMEIIECQKLIVPGHK